MEKTGYIYKITCLANNKVYIGQTIQHYEVRFIQHKSHARTGQSKHKLANALRKYGDDNFIIEMVEECPVEQLNERERYWILYFDSTNDEKGYNINLGGQDYSGYYQVNNEKEIIEFYQQCHNQQETFKHFGITEYKFRQILTKNNIPTDLTNYGKHIAQKVKIVELDLEFESERACAKYIIENNLCKTKQLKCAIVGVNRGIVTGKKVYGLTIVKI